MYSCRSCSCPLGDHNWYTSYKKINSQVCKGCSKTYVKGYMNSKGVPYQLWVGARSRARAKGLPFNLVESDIIIPELCPVFGVPLERADSHTGDNSPTLDKIIPELGYVRGNVAVISWKANRLKSNGTVEDFRKLTEWLEGAQRI